MKILVVDDNCDYLTLIPQFLKRKLGASVQIADCGEAALALLLSGENFDLVICDFLMPDLNGIEVFSRMKEAKISTHFILCTNSRRESIPTVTDTGFLGIIYKNELERLADSASLLKVVPA